MERLGFDENFMDVTEMVERRLKDTRISDLFFSGHVYKHECELERHFQKILTVLNPLVVGLGLQILTSSSKFADSELDEFSVLFLCCLVFNLKWENCYSV